MKHLIRQEIFDLGILHCIIYVSDEADKQNKFLIKSDAINTNTSSDKKIEIEFKIQKKYQIVKSCHQ